MSLMTVEFEWDEEELGLNWMNEDNLKRLIYAEAYTKPELLSLNIIKVER